jgi:hypothetical protein
VAARAGNAVEQGAEAVKTLNGSWRNDPIGVEEPVAEEEVALMLGLNVFSREGESGFAVDGTGGCTAEERRDRLWRFNRNRDCNRSSCRQRDDSADRENEAGPTSHVIRKVSEPAPQV